MESKTWLCTVTSTREWWTWFYPSACKVWLFAMLSIRAWRTSLYPAICKGWLFFQLYIDRSWQRGTIIAWRNHKNTCVQTMFKPPVKLLIMVKGAGLNQLNIVNIFHEFLLRHRNFWCYKIPCFYSFVSSSSCMRRTKVGLCACKKKPSNISRSTIKTSSGWRALLIMTIHRKERSRLEIDSHPASRRQWCHPLQ